MTALWQPTIRRLLDPPLYQSLWLFYFSDYEKLKETLAIFFRYTHFSIVDPLAKVQLKSLVLLAALFARYAQRFDATGQLTSVCHYIRLVLPGNSSTVVFKLIA